MSKKLWTFGDSFTAFFNDKDGWANQYIKWKGYKPKVYGEIIAEKLGYELVNLGRGSSDNYRILETICINSTNIKENDLIIIGWSSSVRFRLVTDDKYEIWEPVLPNVEKHSYKLTFKNTISENTLNEILYNRKSTRYVEEVNNWTLLIDKAFGNNKVIHWSPFGNMGSINTIRGCNRIYEETNGEVADGHYSEIGQKELADELLRIIEVKKSTKNNLI